MGYYDGLGGVTDTASAWQLADTLELPALLVVRPKGASLTLAAELCGLLAFRTPHHIAGILLNDCSESLFKLLAPMLEKESGLPVVGYLPHLPEAAIESRHLGLKKMCIRDRPSILRRCFWSGMWASWSSWQAVL